MTSHDYAVELRRIADELESRPEFDLPDYTRKAYVSFSYFSDKGRFISAVRALGSLSKDFSDKTYLRVSKSLGTTASIDMNVNRDSVCRLVREAEYECEPLLNAEEMAESA